MSLLSNLALLIPAGCKSKKPATTAPIANNEAVTQKEAVATEPQEATSEFKASESATRTAKTLLVYDGTLGSDFETSIKMYAQYHLKGAARQAVSSFDALVALLQQYRTIEKLVLFTHGTGGQISIPGLNNPKYLSEVANMFDSIAPEVTSEVSLDGCNVGSWPEQMLDFKDAFRTPTISAWNYFHVMEPDGVELLGTETADQITADRATAGYPDQYLVPGQDLPSAHAGKSGEFLFAYEWFRRDYEVGKPGSTPDETVHVPRANAGTFERTVSQIKDSAGYVVVPDSSLVHVVIR